MRSVIASVSCHMYDSETILRMSSARINETWDISDPRLGPDHVTSRSCPVCRRDYGCLGHPGHLDLDGVIVNPLMAQTINGILSRTCSQCYAYQEREGRKKCDTCASDIDGLTCRGTSDDRDGGQPGRGRRHAVPRNTGTKRGAARKQVSFARAMEIVSQIKGPEWTQRCFMERIIVPPGAMRQTSDDRSKQSPLAASYANLMSVIRSSTDLVEVYRTYKDMVGSYGMHGDDDTILSFMSGKQGVFRDMMMGKRVEECGRAVIVADDWIRPDEVRIPSKIARNIWAAIKVTDANVHALREMAVHDNLMCSPQRPASISDIKPGKKLVRRLRDGDMVMVNRQPSLTRGSLMALKARISSDTSSVIGINTSVTPSYNADFDGDEMNLFFQDDLSSISEVGALTHAGGCVISSGTSKPIIHPVQDTVTCMYILTRDAMPVSRDVYCNACVSIGARYHHRDSYSTIDLVSLCLPRSLAYKSQNDYGPVVISDGVIMTGVLTKGTLCSSSESILQVVHMTMGYEASTSLIHSMQRLSSLWTMTTSLGLSMSDLHGRNHSNKDMYDDISGDRIRHLSDDDLIRMAGNARSRCESLEALTYMDRNHELGALDAMVASGAKGSVTNLVQIRHMVGQQFVLGSTPRSRGSTNETGTLGSMVMSGFCPSSYTKGLTVKEYVHHQMAGREGVVRTNVSTSIVGYQSRRFVKPMSTLRVGYNGVVFSDTRVVRLVHGRHGIDTSACLPGGRIVTDNIISNI